MHWEERFRTLAEEQEGLIARIHLPSIGCATDHWWQARRNGRWRTWSPRVLSLTGAPATDAQRALAAVLDASPGGMLHGPSTLAWFGLRGYDLATIHVARHRWLTGCPPELGRLHLLRDFRAHDVVVIRGVPTETPLRAIWSEAARYSSKPRYELGLLKVGRLLDDAHKAGLVTWAALHEMVSEISERGRSGARIMKALAADRAPGSSPTESRNEDRLEEILGHAGVRDLRRQPVLGGHEPIGRCDFRDDRLPLAVEVNSLVHHSTPSDRAADTQRYRRLTDAGFTVVVVWEDDLWRRPHAVVEAITEGRFLARAGKREVLHTPSCPWPPNPVLVPRCRA